MKVLICFFLFAGVLEGDSALWQCNADADCGALAGGLCVRGDCRCPAGEQAVGGGTACAPAATYYLSDCVEDFQCARLASGYQCRRDSENRGECACQDGFHYFLGRCWRSKDYGEACSTDQECLSVLRDPYSLACVGGTCACSDGYYLRQRGECRKLAQGVGDECVLDADCQFANGACHYWDLVCYDTSVATLGSHNASARNYAPTRQLDEECADDDDCGVFLVCSEQDHCVCPIGYYASGGSCYAEIGSPVTEEAACNGVFTVTNGVCRCPSNFYPELTMRDCVKATVRFGDSCASDENCLTFGTAGRCGAAREPWGLRECECDPQLAVKDDEQQLCRLYSPLGAECEVASDCLAGQLQVLCEPDAEGVRRCACADGLQQDGDLCVTSGLVLGDECQVTSECGGSPNSECVDGVCRCSAAYVQTGSQCQPAIGGDCGEDADCAVENTGCRLTESGGSCRCLDQFVEFNQTCLPVSAGYGYPCAHAVQCEPTLGQGASCEQGSCVCLASHHYRADYCHTRTGLLDRCSRTSECYLGDLSERVVCRNDFCQCDFNYPYSEDLNTCLDSSASNLLSSISLLIISTYLSIQLR